MIWTSLKLTTAGTPINKTDRQKVTPPRKATIKTMPAKSGPSKPLTIPRKTSSSTKNPATPKNGLSITVGETSNTPSTVATTPGPAAKKQKTETPKKKKKKDSGPPLEPGNRNKTSTFLPQGWQLEGQCAAYLGFTQIQHLRMFAISPIVLDAFVEGHGDLTPAKHSKVLEILRDCRDFDDIMEATSNAPRLDFKEPLVFPKLGPFLDLKEDDLEAYNRAYFPLRYLTYSTQSPWEKRFGTDEWDRRVMVDDSLIPHWMRPKTTPSEATALDVPMKPVGPTAPEKPMRKLKVMWLFNHKSKPALEFKRFREEEEDAGMQEHTMPSLEQNITVADETSIEEFRNNIRTPYRLELLDAQINTLSLRKHLQDGTRQAFQITSSRSWNEQVKEQLWLPDLDVEKSLFQFTVRPSGPGEVIMEKTVIAALR
jgi:hypothetical protein